MLGVSQKPGRSHKIETRSIALNRLLMLERMAATGSMAQNRQASKEVTIAVRFEYDRHL
ncbi:hypothetical protein [Microcoleus sp. herbarium2]|uniref:hypothetical protein n=1 Tax=Microcoleus sp. herbarium2 TaxID=3055433 RepID=UPI002FD2EB0F